MKKLSLKKIIAYLFIIIGLVAVTAPFLMRAISLQKENVAYESFIKNYDKIDQKDLEAKAKAYNERIKNSEVAKVDPFEKKSFESETILKNKDEIFAYIRIPKLKIKLPIYLDASTYHIAIGVAQISGTDIPIGGESTRSVIAGHRGYWDKNMFLYIDDLVKGDSIYIDRGKKTLHYRVSDKEIIGPYDWDKLKPIEGEDMITLLTCDPFIPPSPNRLLVNAKRVKEDISSQPDNSLDIGGKSLVGKDYMDEASKKASLLEIMDYSIAILGCLAILITLIKLIKYLIKRSENE